MPDLRCCVYGRFSERPDDPALVASLKTQAERNVQYCAFAGLQIAETIEDPETSALKYALLERPNGRRLKELLGRKRIRHIVAYRLDRLFRNVRDGLAVIDAWERQGITLHLADEGGMTLNTSTAFGWLMVAQRLVFAEFEPRLSKERTRTSMRSRQSGGRAMSKIPPYGQALGERVENGKGKLVHTLVAVPAELAEIAKMVRSRANGASYGAIARDLNERGVPTKTGALWSKVVVRDVIARAAREKV